MEYIEKAIEGWKSLKFHEKVTIVLSIIAILLSGISGYYQFFYSKDELLLTVTEVNFDSKRNKLEVDVVFLNNGTEPQLITEYELGIKKSPRSGVRALGNFDNLFSDIGNAMVIKAGEITLKSLSVELSDQDLKFLKDEEELPYDIFIQLIIVSKNGKHYANNTQLASVDKGEQSSSVLIYRDVINILDSGDLYRKKNENFVSKGFVAFSMPEN